MVSFLRSWTIARATQTGLIAALAALVLWPAYERFGSVLRVPFATALAILGFCGISILLITASDISRHSRRGRHIRAMRTFDVVVGALMAAPCILTLPTILG